MFTKLLNPLSIVILTALAIPAFATDTCFGPLKEDPKKVLDLPEGFSYEVLLQTGKKMSDGKNFPRDPDLIAYLPLSQKSAFLIIGHEIADDEDKNLDNWYWQGSLTRHYLVDGKIKESKLLAGEMRNNCSGSLTPWGTVLTNEENPRDPSSQYPNEGFTWEIDPITGEKTKRTALGRYSHESSLVAPDGSIYLTDDYAPGLLFRFIPQTPGDLSAGRLFSYRKENKSWILIEKPMNAREEGLAKGATPFNRLEGLALSPKGDTLYISTTGNKDPAKKDLYGAIFKMSLKDFSLKSIYEGRADGFMNADNLLTDPKGNIWVMEDRFWTHIKEHGNNGIWKLNSQGKACRFANLADKECEPTGPIFTPDGKTLFVNIMCENGSGKTLRVTGF